MSDVSAPPSMECAGGASAPSPSTHGRKEGGRAVASSRGKVTDAGVRIGGSFSPAPDPAWVKSRNDVLEAVVARQAALLESVAKPPITVTLPDGSTRPATAFVTSPLDIATAISKGLAQACCVASVSYAKGERLPSPLEAGMVAMANGPDEEEGEVSEDWELWDLNRPLEGSCELKLHKFGDAEGQITFWRRLLLLPPSLPPPGRRVWWEGRRLSPSAPRPQALVGAHPRRGARVALRRPPDSPPSTLLLLLSFNRSLSHQAPT